MYFSPKEQDIFVKNFIHEWQFPPPFIPIFLCLESFLIEYTVCVKLLLQDKHEEKNCTSSPKQMTQQTFCNNPFLKMLETIENTRIYSWKLTSGFDFSLTLFKNVLDV